MQEIDDLRMLPCDLWGSKGMLEDWQPGMIVVGCRTCNQQG